METKWNGHRPVSGGFRRPAVSQPQPSRLTAGQREAFTVRLTRLTTVVVPQRLGEVKRAQVQVGLAQASLGQAQAALRKGVLPGLTAAAAAASARLAAATTPEAASQARAALQRANRALELAKSSGTTEADFLKLREAVEAVRRDLVGGVNGAANPAAEVEARAQLAAFERPLSVLDDRVAAAREHLSSSGANLSVANARLAAAQENANGLAVSLGRPAPYSSGGGWLR